jgi:hypothetical protein
MLANSSWRVKQIKTLYYPKNFSLSPFFLRPVSHEERKAFGGEVF